ncbi:MAG TPA: C40 family peptidase [Flavisolibacter sp.]|jgi:cell wall-associated NlpC family hydrolase|nr:C40 family peptidase [Flavisolibacter sp.]
MSFAICIVPAVPVRKEPSHRAEMVNQLLFGERIVIQQQEGEWYFIKSLYDQYEGWTTFHSIEHIKKETAEQTALYAPEILNKLWYKDAPMHIPMGSELIGYEPQLGYLWNKDYIYKAGEQSSDSGFTEDSLIRIARSWLNAPYLWGGKTILGVDCSGFVQTVFKVLGILLHRDAYQQAEMGEPVNDLLSTKIGDLAFFNNEKGRITHVGIIWKEGYIIHASGSVRIDHLNEEGIIHCQTGIRSHQLHSVRRVAG